MLLILASKFLVCGAYQSASPLRKKSQKVRMQKNSRIGLGLMGMHEWLLTAWIHKYEMTDELKQWMRVL